MNYCVIAILFLVITCQVQSVNGAGKILQLQKRDTSSEECKCEWSVWMNNPEYSSEINKDDNSYETLRNYYDFCDQPSDIACRSKLNPLLPFNVAQSKELNCDVTSGLICVSHPRNITAGEKSFYCDDYELRVRCCECPSTSVEATPVYLINITSTAPTAAISNKGDETTSTLAQHPLVLPVSIIIVIVVAVLLICGIVLCVVVTHKDKKEPKFSHHYMSEDSYLQRPVSFTDVDLMRSDSLSSTSSSKSGQSETSERRVLHFTELSKAKLEFLQAEPEDEPDLVSSTKRTNHEPILRHVGERRWLPDEHAPRRDVHALRSGKKSIFSRGVPPPPVPPPPPIKKSVAFPDENK